MKQFVHAALERVAPARNGDGSGFRVCKTIRKSFVIGGILTQGLGSIKG